MQNISIVEVNTPLGKMVATASGSTPAGSVLTGLWYPEHWNPEHFGERPKTLQMDEVRGTLASVEKELQQYFNGERRRFTVPTAVIEDPGLLKGTELQKAVWQHIARVEFGELATYGEIAHALGKPKAARPVGQAVGRNPISIVVGCHRIVGANGKITGYAGGLERKRALLRIEGHADYDDPAGR